MSSSDRVHLAAVLLIVLAVACLRVRLLPVPLERDEGEYAYAGQLMLQGVPPYQLAANMKLPGTYAAYAVILALFGQTITAIHVGLLLVNAANMLLVFAIGRRLYGPAAGVAACAAYGTMSIGSAVLGTQAHATHFVVLAALGGVWFLLRHRDTGRLATLWWSGLLFGVAFVMKQHGAAFAVFGAVWIVLEGWRHRHALIARLACYSAGVAMPFAITCLVLWRAGVFAKFWFWTFTYARQYAGENTLTAGLQYFSDTFVPLILQNAGLFLLAAAGLLLLIFRRTWHFSLVFLALSFLATCPGFFFREHYFVMLLPAVALLAGAAVGGAWESYRGLLWLVLAASIGLALWDQHNLLFRLSPDEVSRELYGDNPFPEALTAAAYIREHSSPSDRVAILGSEPEIYFYSHRRSATSHIYMYGLMEAQPYALTMQDDLIREVEASAPQFMVYVSTGTSWLRDEQSPSRLFDWWRDYGPIHYTPVYTGGPISIYRRRI